MNQTFTAEEYLAIDLANCYGLDKLTWDERLAWFQANKSDLDSLVPQAKEPNRFRACLQAIRATINGETIGYPISLDATASGSQLLAVLGQCSRTAARCNLINSGVREDVYASFYGYLREQYPELPEYIDHELVKKAVMTALYGSKATPRKLFGEEFLPYFWQALSEFMPGAWGMFLFIHSLQDPTRTYHNWVLPDGFEVNFPVTAKVKESVIFAGEVHDVVTEHIAPTDEDRSISANLVHSLDAYVAREVVSRCMYDPVKVEYIRSLLGSKNKNNYECSMTSKLWSLYQESGVLSVRILNRLNKGTMHLVDHEVIEDLLDTLPKKPFELLVIHDCFRCLPQYGNDIRHQYKTVLSSLANSHITEFLVNRIAGRKVIESTPDINLAVGIMLSEYALS